MRCYEFSSAFGGLPFTELAHFIEDLLLSNALGKTVDPLFYLHPGMLSFLLPVKTGLDHFCLALTFSCENGLYHTFFTMLKRIVSEDFVPR